MGSELNIKREKELVSFFKEKGLTVVHPNIEAFKTRVDKIYLENKDFINKWDMDLYKQIQNNK